jgi:hypothetical protein
MIKLARDHFRLAGVIVEVLLLACDFKMAGAGEIAIDFFVPDDLLDAINGGQ